MRTLENAPFIAPLGWTLLHFLWQGTMFALFLAAFLCVFRRGAAQTRYLAACMTLLAMALCPVITFTLLARSAAEMANSRQPIQTYADSAVIAPQSGQIYDLASPLPIRLEPSDAIPATSLQFAQRLRGALPWLVGAWSFGVLALSLRMLGGWFAVGLLRRETAPVESWVRDCLDALARKMEIRRQVDVLASARIEVPAMLGCWRTVILLPAGALAGLSVPALEAILAHELAHIRRHDYLVNLFQTAIETLLFYHPAAWWVSKQIRTERENCCDDLAVEILGDRVTYARALTRLEEMRLIPNALAMASNGGDLLGRIRRLAAPPAPASTTSPVWIAALMTTALLLTTGAALRLTASPHTTPMPETAARVSEATKNLLDAPTFSHAQQFYFMEAAQERTPSVEMIPAPAFGSLSRRAAVAAAQRNLAASALSRRKVIDVPPRLALVQHTAGKQDTTAPQKADRPTDNDEAEAREEADSNASDREFEAKVDALANRVAQSSLNELQLNRFSAEVTKLSQERARRGIEAGLRALKASLKYLPEPRTEESDSSK